MKLLRFLFVLLSGLFIADFVHAEVVYNPGGAESTLTFVLPLLKTVNSISMGTATTSVNGYLSSTDWTTFNSKQAVLSNSAGLASALSDETGTGTAVFNQSPAITNATLTTPILGTPQSGTLTNCTFPTLNQNTSGTSANVTGIVALANGGTAGTSSATARVNLGIDVRRTFSDADITIVNTDKVIAQIGTMSASRVATLPLASTCNHGQEFVIKDNSGSVTSTNTITITRAGSDTIDGTTTEVIGAAYGQRVLFCDGVSKYSFDKDVLRASNNLSDVLSTASLIGLNNVNGTTSTFLDIYATKTDVNNYAYLEINPTTTGFKFTTKLLGTSAGTNVPFIFQTSGTSTSSGFIIKDSAGTAKFTMTDVGFVGIGTSTPQYIFDVYQNTNSSTGIRIMNIHTGGNSNIFIDAITSAGARPFLGLNDSGTTKGIISLERTTSQIFGVTRNDLLIYTVSTNNIVFGTNSSANMTISSGGNVGIGTTTPSAVLHLKASTAATGTASLKISAGTVATTPVSGNIESDGTNLYWTDNTNTRRQLNN